MDNSEIRAAFVHKTDNEQKKQKTQHRNIKRSATRTAKKIGVNPRAHKGQVYFVSYETSAMLLIVQSGNSLVGEERTNLRERVQFLFIYMVCTFISIFKTTTEYNVVRKIANNDINIDIGFALL